LIVAHPLHEKAVPDTNAIAPPMHPILIQPDNIVTLSANS
jgi:hypothetical protein